MSAFEYRDDGSIHHVLYGRVIKEGSEYVTVTGTRLNSFGGVVWEEERSKPRGDGLQAVPALICALLAAIFAARYIPRGADFGIWVLAAAAALGLIVGLALTYLHPKASWVFALTILAAVFVLPAIKLVF